MRNQASSYADEELVEVTDIKQLAFCERIPYFMYVLGMKERVTFSMREGKLEQEKTEKLESRRVRLLKRFPSDEKMFDVYLFSERLRLKGKLDCLVKVGEEYVPVEYKVAKKPKEVPLNHLLQLAAYALLVEERFKRYVRRGFIYYGRSDYVVEVKLTPDLKRRVLKLVKKVIDTISIELIPEVRQPIRKCMNCGYSWVCQRA